MSHIVCILRACAPPNIDALLEGFCKNAPAFVDVDVYEGVLPYRVRAASIYIGHVAPYWGAELARQTEAAVIGMAPGFADFLNSIDRESGRSVMFVFMGGEEYFNMSMTDYQPPCDFYMPWHSTLPILPKRQVIPLHAIEKHVEFCLKKSIDNFTAIRALNPDMQIFNVICPPPLPKEFLHKVDGIPNSVQENSFRLKCYHLYVKTLTEATSRLNIKSLMPPPIAIDNNGMAKPEYMNDNIHGNTLFGKEVLAQINELLQTRCG